MGYPVHTQTEREALLLSQVEEFATWLEEYGWNHIPVYGEYEILRMSHRVYEGLILVWKREGAKARGYATLQGASTRWYYRWKKHNENAARIASG